MIVVCDSSKIKMSLLMLILFYNSHLNSGMGINNENDIERCQNKYEHEAGRLDVGIVDLDSNIAKVCERLRSLDKTLTEMYRDPPVDGGEEIMRLSRTYNQACLDLLYFCTLDKMKALKAAQDIVDSGSPKFLDVDIDEKKLEERFKWDENAVDSLHIIRKYTYEHWYDLWHLYNNLPN